MGDASLLISFNRIGSVYDGLAPSSPSFLFLEIWSVNSSWRFLYIHFSPRRVQAKVEGRLPGRGLKHYFTLAILFMWLKAR